VEGRSFGNGDLSGSRKVGTGSIGVNLWFVAIRENFEEGLSAGLGEASAQWADLSGTASAAERGAAPFARLATFQTRYAAQCARPLVPKLLA
jgi:hypothetical protein